MADSTLTPAGDSFRAGAVLGRSFTIFLGNFPAFLVISLVMSLPTYLFYLWINYGSADAFADSATGVLSNLWLVGGIAMIIEVVFTFAATAAISYGTLRHLQGRPVGFGKNLGKGLAMVLPVVLVSLAATLVMLVGFIMLVIPGLILTVMFWVVVPVAVVERRGIRGSMERSSALTKAYRWPIFGLLLLSMAMERSLTFVAEQLLDYEAYYDQSLAIESGAGALLLAFWSVVAAVSYHDLRRAKEGTATDQIAAVFD